MKYYMSYKALHYIMFCQATCKYSCNFLKLRFEDLHVLITEVHQHYTFMCNMPDLRGTWRICIWHATLLHVRSFSLLRCFFFCDLKEFFSPQFSRVFFLFSFFLLSSHSRGFSLSPSFKFFLISLFLFQAFKAQSLYFCSAFSFTISFSISLVFSSFCAVFWRLISFLPSVFFSRCLSFFLSHFSFRSLFLLLSARLFLSLFVSLSLSPSLCLALFVVTRPPRLPLPSTLQCVGAQHTAVAVCCNVLQCTPVSLFLSVPTPPNATTYECISPETALYSFLFLWSQQHPQHVVSVGWVCVWERERQKDSDRERQRETDRGRQREKDRDRDTFCESARQHGLA